MREQAIVPSGGTDPALAGTLASGSTPADDPASIAPDADGFVVAATRALCRSRAGGIAIVVTSPGVPITAGATKTHAKATLTVVNATGEPLSEPMLVYEHGGAIDVEPLAGHVLRLGSPPLAAFTDPGRIVRLVWNETGTWGMSEDEIPIPGKRPEFVLLGWPLIAIDSTSL